MPSKVFKIDTVFDSDKKIWKGPKTALLTGPDVSVGRLLLESLLKHPDHISQICDNNGRNYSNQDIATMSISVAQHLEGLGVQKEDIVTICASNTDFLAPLVFGALLCGITLSTLDPSLDKDVMHHIFSMARSKIVFCDGKVYNRLKSALLETPHNVPFYTMKDHVEGVKQIQELITPTGREHLFKPIKISSSQTAIVLCSSGTTGCPKLVCNSHENLLNNRVLDFSLEDKLLCFSTLYWATGVYCLIEGTLKGCTRVITDQPFSPELFLKIVEKQQINCVFSPPSQMVLAVKSPYFRSTNLSSLEVAFTCGGSVPFTVIEEFSKQANNCQILSGYGMSEVNGGCSFGAPTIGGDNGKLQPNVEVKIIDSFGNSMGIGHKGEILIKAPCKWNGYYNNPSATTAIYNTDGWIHSGDIGYFNDKGQLFVVDRIKDILKYNNFHFSPSEIEEIIMQIPDVVEVCVFGLPNEMYGFLPTAAVIKKTNSSLTENDVQKYVAEERAHYKHLHGGVYFVEALEKTASGKNIRSKALKFINHLHSCFK